MNLTVVDICQIMITFIHLKNILVAKISFNSYYITMLQPINNIDEYKRVKDELKKRFETERSGKQSYSESSLKFYSL